MLKLYDRAIDWVSGRIPEAFTLLFLRVVLAGIFWRSGRTKVEEGSLLSITNTTYFLFEEEYAGVPFPAELAAQMATAAEFFLPILLVLGLFTRFSALALLGMTAVIQLFVYPDAWWTVHALWAAMALVLIVNGGGLLSLDAVLTRGRKAGETDTVV